MISSERPILKFPRDAACFPEPKNIRCPPLRLRAFAHEPGASRGEELGNGNARQLAAPQPLSRNQRFADLPLLFTIIGAQLRPSSGEGLC